jgi:hypothetical protein
MLLPFVAVLLLPPVANLLLSCSCISDLLLPPVALLLLLPDANLLLTPVANFPLGCISDLLLPPVAVLLLPPVANLLLCCISVLPLTPVCSTTTFGFDGPSFRTAGEPPALA